VQQPVIQFGTAIHGESFSGGALNRFQKLMQFADILSVQRSKMGIYRRDSSKPGGTELCNADHIDEGGFDQEGRPESTCEANRAAQAEIGIRVRKGHPSYNPALLM
jgi:hypothetical protein